MVPHSCSWPSEPTSTIRPPSLASTRSAFTVWPRITEVANLSVGHQLPMSTNTVNAFSWLQGPSMVFTRGSSISSLLGLVLHASRDLGAVRVQDVGPEPLQVPPQLVQTVAPHRVHTAVAARLDAHQARPLQHLQVLRHGGPACPPALPPLSHRPRLRPPR